MKQKSQTVLDSSHPQIHRVLGELESLLDDALQEQRLVGMSAAVVYDQEILWAKGFGYANLDKQTPADTETVYNIASVTKIFTATMLMKLRDAGKLSLDDAIEDYLPEFSTKSQFNDPRPSTFRQMIAHVAGLPREPEGKTGEAWPPVDVFLENLRDIDLIFPPYTESKYSNLGISIIGHALSRVAGQPYRDYVVEHIFLPLGMECSGWELTDEMKAHLAVGYAALENDQPRQIAAHYELGEAGAPAGGVYTTVADLARFMSLQFREGPAGGTQILGSTTLREMRAPVFVNRDWSGGFGIGWYLGRVAGYPTAEHGGGQSGYAAKIHLVPELKLGFAICINQIADQHRISYTALELLVPVFDSILSEAMFRPLPPGAEKLTGVYVEETGAATIEVIIEGKRLFIVQLHEGVNVGQWEAMPEDGYVFRMMGGPLSGELASFRLGLTGEATSVTCGGYVFERKQA